MNCAHARLRADVGSNFDYDLVETYRASSATCSHCDLLLKAVEAYKPGWMDQIDGEGEHEIWLDRYTKGPHVVSLTEFTADNGRTEVGSFRYLRKPQGMLFQGPKESKHSSILTTIKMILYIMTRGKTEIKCMADGGQIETSCMRVWRLLETLPRLWHSTVFPNGSHIVSRTTRIAACPIPNIYPTAFSMSAQMLDAIRSSLNPRHRCHTFVLVIAGEKIPAVS